MLGSGTTAACRSTIAVCFGLNLILQGAGITTMFSCCCSQGWYFDPAVCLTSTSFTFMLRCFDSSEIQNVNKTVDPVRDLETVETEMMISDLESVEKRLSQKKIKIMI